MIEQSKTCGERRRTFENPKLVRDRNPGSKIGMIPTNVLARADRVIK
jgi:hypothetical protein